MQKIVVDATLLGKLQNILGPVEFVTSTGRKLGQFVPEVNDNCPYTEEQIAVFRAEEGGRSLPEIWKSLGVK